MSRPTTPLLVISSAQGPMLVHAAGPGHPERPDRLTAALDAISRLPATALTIVPPGPAPREALLRVHTPEHVEAIESERAEPFWIDSDTAGNRATVDAAFLSAGAAIDTVEAVCHGSAPVAWALTRPPGHHAEADRAMGFCFFNNVAVAAAHAVAVLGMQRVLIVDWDVHHGNGTQHIFDHRRDVLVFNIHERGNYPGTGAVDEVGGPGAEGFTINAPLPSGSVDGDYIEVFERVLRPVAAAFSPDLVLVSAGFDAHQRDPLGGMRLTAGGFARLAGIVQGIARDHAGGRLALVLEGGYDLLGLGESVHACARVLTGLDAPPSSSGLPPPTHGTTEVIEALAAAHAPFWPGVIR